MGENCVIIRSLVSSQHQRVTDGQTDGQTDARTVDMPHVATGGLVASVVIWFGLRVDGHLAPFYVIK